MILVWLTALPQASVTVTVIVQLVATVTIGAVKLVVALVGLEKVPPQLDDHW